ncbi:hypothetical protein AAKU52_003344 [Pedobacter sp. CG_S7]|uniref:RagB/SusD family nutrient uptake outer membrane protein n=1 Tax=Pedobacter sp. CG_S7 TaxID=3143930 RepID=UPI003396CF10
MKSIFSKVVVVFLLATTVSSCKKDFLNEVPLDFYNPENAFSSISGFEAALTDLYVKEREIYYSGQDVSYSLLFGTDVFLNARGNDGSQDKISILSNSLGASTNISEWYWNKNYKIIADANLIISNSASSTLPEADKLRLSSEAKFFRAKAYRDLVYLYGGVPLILEVVTGPKADFVRSTKVEILNQMAADFKDAADNLAPISQVQDGRVSNIVASHYLAETYISLGRPGDAIAEASKVITAPNVGLMTARFGKRIGETSKDVFWDLFQRGNQNRSNGNKEALWVCQFQEDVQGGGLLTNSRQYNVLERMHVPAVWSMTDPAGKPGFLGRRSDANVGGQGVSFLQPTQFASKDMWPANYIGDMRCNDNNFIKDAYYDNPASAFFGKSVTLNKPGNYNSWRFYPWFIKATTPGDHPVGLIDPSNPLLLSGNSGSTYHDQYYLRLAETHLLRAEAYLANSQPDKAKEDIDVVRLRANAAPVSLAEVTLDYILDERARELNLEEQRHVTLRRVGKYGERVVKYNALTGPSYNPKFELFPIPQKEIEANIDAVLIQNPGY